jgi:hypothetical protein
MYNKRVPTQRAFLRIHEGRPFVLFLRILLISGLQKIVRERGATPKYEEVYFDSTLMINFFHKAKKFLY